MLFIPVIVLALIFGFIINAFNKPDEYDYNEAYKDSYIILKYVNECCSNIDNTLLKDYKQALKDNRVSLAIGKTEYDASTNKLTYNSKAI